MRALAADKFRAGPRTNQRCLADRLERKPNRNGDLLQMHADQRSADVHPGLRADLLHRDRIVKILIRSRCKRAARLRLRDNVHDLAVLPLRHGALCNDRAV